MDYLNCDILSAFKDWKPTKLQRSIKSVTEQCRVYLNDVIIRKQQKWGCLTKEGEMQAGGGSNTVRAVLPWPGHTAIPKQGTKSRAGDSV